MDYSYVRIGNLFLKFSRFCFLQITYLIYIFEILRLSVTNFLHYKTYTFLSILVTFKFSAYVALCGLSPTIAGISHIADKLLIWYTLVVNKIFCKFYKI